ncbi:ribonuclease H2 subunit B-like isoform X2 [Homarus americanus]|uniref:ribonuclease H2 subunit B-like isoform X2 n=1 Tax=Homarus americanus TaxID=6706 RepID=UPI001C446762|nr:ribonuclease H2 subunit B-like isoform X2 [Homarus americanus]
MTDGSRDSLFSSSNIQVIKLKHPNTNKSAMYVFDEDHKKILDLVAFDESHRSWFIGETIQSDGRLYIMSPVDVTYLVLPYLMKATQNIPIDHLLVDPEFPAISHLAAVAATKDFSHVAEKKGTAELGVWKYSEARTLSWLEERVRQLFKLLQEKKVPTSSGQSFTYVRTMDSEQTIEAYLVLAHGIVSEYVSKDLSQLLHKHLKLPEVKNKQKHLMGMENQPPSKKQKAEGPVEDYTKNNTPVNKVKTPQTAKAKALAKSASGSKNITSFFCKK